jgi:hypothetical protein
MAAGARLPALPARCRPRRVWLPRGAGPPGSHAIAGPRTGGDWPSGPLVGGARESFRQSGHKDAVGLDSRRLLLLTTTVSVEMESETFGATSVITTGEDRDGLFAGVVAGQPVFGSYQRRTKRVIPVVELIRGPSPIS